MQNKYFSESEFQYAMKLLESDPYKAKERLEAYFHKYPTDYYGRSYYAILLTRICMFKEAEEEYEAIIQEVSNDGNFYAYSSVKNLQGFKHNMVLLKLKILGEQEKYEEIFTLMQNHLDMFNKDDQTFLSYYCRSKLGLISKDIVDHNINAYRFNQTVDYSEERFRNHVKKHEADYNMDIDNPNESIFGADFPIDTIIDEIKKYIPSNKRLFPGYFDDAYYFKFDNCGRVNNHVTNYFYVVCYHNTKNFITMCPCIDCEKLPYIDLNYLKEKGENLQNDRPSQIDKFNRRFKRN